MKVRAMKSITPSVHIPQDTWDDMMHITAIVDKEVGWFTRVHREDYEFTLYEVHLPKQQSSGTTVEFEPEHLEAYLLELMERDPKNFGALNSSLRGWCHSHVNMGTSPSSQDQTTIEKLAQNVDYFVAVRVNKRGEVEADVVLSDLKMVFEDVKVTVGEIDMTRREHWRSLIKDRVLPMPAYSYKSQPRYGSGYYGGKTTKDMSIVPYGYGLDRWDDDGWPAGVYGKDTAPAKSQAAGQPDISFLGLSTKEADRISKGWWAAVDNNWPELHDAYFEQAQFLSEEEAIAPMLDLTRAALDEQDAADVLRLMEDLDVDLLDLIDAGWQPRNGWHQTLASYKAALVREATKLEVLDS